MRLTDKEIACYADDIFEQLRILDSPKDAASIIVLAQFLIFKDSFEPENRTDAIKAVEEQCKLLKSFLNEGWN